jgi:hypothetical protein
MVNPKPQVPVALAPGEQIVAQDQYMFSLAHFFLYTNVLLTDRRLAWQRPNTLAGLIPLGGQLTTFPLANIGYNVHLDPPLETDLRWAGQPRRAV